MRGGAPRGPANIQPTFPNPIQRPSGPPVLPSRTLDMQQFGPSSNNSGSGILPNKGGGNLNNLGNNSGGVGPGGPGPMPLNLSAMNMGNNAFLSLINVAKNVITQMSGASNVGGPNPFAMKGPGPAPGAYMGPPNRDGPPRSAPHNSGPHQNTKGPGGQPQGGNQKSSNSALHHTSGHYGSDPGATNNPQKAPGSYPGPLNSIKAQQAQQRQELLTIAANFLNSNKAAPATKPSGAASTTSTTDTGSNSTVGQPGKSDDKKPALAMVSNPSLVGTSVKINFTASSNTRAPAMPVTSTAAVSAHTATSASPSNSKIATNSSNTVVTTAPTATTSSTSAGNSTGHKEEKKK